jgi:glycerol-3-phosphate dehydrogenase (NAD(P)+)
MENASGDNHAISAVTRAAVLGAGSWGTTVASLLSARVPTLVWARREETAAEINRAHSNLSYLPGLTLPAALQATSSLAAAVQDADVIFVGVPSHGFREVVRELAPFVGMRTPLLSLSKGVEAVTNARMTQILHEELPGRPIGVVTGPNLAREIMTGHPAATVVALHDHGLATAIQDVLTGPSLLVYRNPDVVGCEVAGAMKNVIAVACGMAEGLGFGDNTRATIITRGLAELSRLGEQLGGQQSTFAGLAGMGDLVATCISPQSRNRTVGFLLGQGRTLAEILAEMHMVAEGVKSCRPLLATAAGFGIEMPICEQVVAVCHEGRTAREAGIELLARKVGVE